MEVRDTDWRAAGITLSVQDRDEWMPQLGWRSAALFASCHLHREAPTPVGSSTPRAGEPMPALGVE